MTKPTPQEVGSAVHGAGHESILCAKADGVATITLNRPERLNAINRKLIDELHGAISECMDNDDVASIVLTGAGRAFCAGDDLKDMPTEFVLDGQFENTVATLQDISRLLVLGPKPVVAAVRGWAVGGGLSWALNCDAAIFSANVVAFFPEVRLGLSVTGGVTYLLPAAIGRGRARSILMTGRRFSGQEAFDYGLAAQVVPEDQLDAAALEHAKGLAGLPASALGELKRALGGRDRLAFEEALANEAAMLIRLTGEIASRRAWPSIE